MNPPANRMEVREVANRRDREAFIRLPGRLAAGDPNWVEPLRLERREFLSPRRNPVFEHCEARFWLALRDGRPVGRISAQIDSLTPQEAGGPVGFFGMIDARDDAALSALFGAAEGWLAARGIRRVRGPFSLSVNQSCGLLVEGFDTPPYVLMEHHAPWLGPAVERQGYAKARDLVAYTLDTRKGLPERMRAAAERASAAATIRKLDPRRYDADLRAMTGVFNDAWAGNWGFVPLTEAETAAMARDLKPVLHPEFVRIAELDGEPVGFIVLLPNLNEAIADLGGRLLPFGWAKLLWRLKVRGLRTGRVPLMGVRRDVADTMLGKMLPLRLIYALQPDALARGVEELEMSWLLEDNRPVRRLIESLGSRLSKTYRIYEKDLG